RSGTTASRRWRPVSRASKSSPASRSRGVLLSGRSCAPTGARGVVRPARPAAVREARRHVRVDVLGPAHAGDHGRDRVEGEAEPERDLGQVVDRCAELVRDRVHPLPHLLPAVAGEVPASPVALGKLRLGPDASGERALVERDAHDHPDTGPRRGGEELVLGALLEDVEDHLHGVDDAGLDQAQDVRRLVVVHGDAEETDLAVGLQPLGALEPAAPADPLVRPDVELLHVDRLDAEVAEAALRALDDPVGGKRLLRIRSRQSGPAGVLRRDLRRDRDLLRRVAHGSADELLAVAVSVAERRVDERDALVERPPQRAKRLVVFGADPHVLADAPGAVAKRRHARAAAAERTLLHYVGGAVESRTISCVRSSTWSASIVWFSSRRSSRLTAIRPISASGWRTVVSEGVTIAAASTSSKPTTERSSGTRRPRSCAACIVPIAMLSLKPKTAVGGFGRSSSCRAAS